MMKAMAQVGALITAGVSSIAALGSGAFIVPGMHTLQTRDLGLGGVGLTIGLILVAALVFLPALVCLALARYVYYSRRWAIKIVLSIASFHLLLTLFVGFTAMSSSRPSGAAMVLVLMMTAIQIVQIYCLARTFAAMSRHSQARGFDPVMKTL